MNAADLIAKAPKPAPSPQQPSEAAAQLAKDIATGSLDPKAGQISIAAAANRRPGDRRTG